MPPGGQVDDRAAGQGPPAVPARFDRSTACITASCQDFPFGAERPAPGQVAAAGRSAPPHVPADVPAEADPVQADAGARRAGSSPPIVGARAPAAPRRRRARARHGPPGAPPLGFQAAPQGSTTIFLSWDRVPNAAGYDIRRTTPEGQLSGPVEVARRRLDAEPADRGPRAERASTASPSSPPVRRTSTRSPPSPHACATTDPTPTLDRAGQLRRHTGVAGRVPPDVGAPVAGGRDVHDLCGRRTGQGRRRRRSRRRSSWR